MGGGRTAGWKGGRTSGRRAHKGSCPVPRIKAICCSRVHEVEKVSACVCVWVCLCCTNVRDVQATLADSALYVRYLRKRLLELELQLARQQQQQQQQQHQQQPTSDGERANQLFQAGHAAPAHTRLTPVCFPPGTPQAAPALGLRPVAVVVAVRVCSAWPPSAPPSTGRWRRRLRAARRSGASGCGSCSCAGIQVSCCSQAGIW